MNQTKIKITKRMAAIDKDGKRYTIIEYTTFHDASEFGIPVRWEPVKKKYKLADGTPINRPSDTEFEAMLPGGIIKLSILP